MDVIKNGIFKKTMIFLLAVFLMNSEQLKSGELMQQKIDGRSLAIGFFAGGAVVALFGWYLWRANSTVHLGHDYLMGQIKDRDDQIKEKEGKIQNSDSRNKYLQGENKTLREDNKKYKDIEAANRYLTRDKEAVERELSSLKTHASGDGTLALIAERDKAVRRAQEADNKALQADTEKNRLHRLNIKLAARNRNCTCKPPMYEDFHVEGVDE